MTFKHRGTGFVVSDILGVLYTLEREADLHIRWKAYQKRFSYASEVEFQDAIDSIKSILISIQEF